MLIDCDPWSRRRHRVVDRRPTGGPRRHHDGERQCRHRAHDPQRARRRRGDRRSTSRCTAGRARPLHGADDRRRVRARSRPGSATVEIPELDPRRSHPTTPSGSSSTPPAAIDGLQLVAVGPLTNIALALRRDPDAPRPDSAGSRSWAVPLAAATRHPDRGVQRLGRPRSGGDRLPRVPDDHHGRPRRHPSGAHAVPPTAIASAPRPARRPPSPPISSTTPSPAPVPSAGRDGAPIHDATAVMAVVEPETVHGPRPIPSRSNSTGCAHPRDDRRRRTDPAWSAPARDRTTANAARACFDADEHRRGGRHRRRDHRRSTPGARDQRLRRRGPLGRSGRSTRSFPIWVISHAGCGSRSTGSATPTEAASGPRATGSRASRAERRREARRRQRAEDDAAIRATLRDAYGASSLRLDVESSAARNSAIDADEELVRPDPETGASSPTKRSPRCSACSTRPASSPCSAPIDPDRPFVVEPAMPRGRWRRRRRPDDAEPKTGKPPTCRHRAGSRLEEPRRRTPMWGRVNRDRMRNGKPPRVDSTRSLGKAETGGRSTSPPPSPGWKGDLVDPFACGAGGARTRRRAGRHSTMPRSRHEFSTASDLWLDELTDAAEVDGVRSCTRRSPSTSTSTSVADRSRRRFARR